MHIGQKNTIFQRSLRQGTAYPLLCGGQSSPRNQNEVGDSGYRHKTKNLEIVRLLPAA